MTEELIKINFSNVFDIKTNHAPTPLWRTGNGQYLWTPFHGTSAKKVLVNTVPKSGTYLLSKALELAGVRNTGVHLRNNWMWDFRDQTIESVIREPNAFKISIPLHHSLSMVQEGQFVVGHLENTSEIPLNIKEFSHIFAIRNVIDVLISHMRFVVDERMKSRQTYLDSIEDGPERFAIYLESTGRSYFQGIQRQLSWLSSPDIIVVRFETLVGDNGEAARSKLAKLIQDYIQLPKEKDFEKCLIEAIGMPTRTFSGQRSDAGKYLTSRILRQLDSMGIRKFNEELGYV